MKYTYKIASFVPKVKGCGAQDNGWDQQRCEQFQLFLNSHADEGWKLHSTEYRNVIVKGCGGKNGNLLICTFEKQA